MNKINYHRNRLLGIVGHPIEHSLSPVMHNRAIESLGLDYIYLPFDIPNENFNDAIKGLVALGIKGFNVTLPFKEKIFSYLSELSDEAVMIGSVNTVLNQEGVLTGYNTDYNGIYESLREYKEEITGKQVFIFGAGGVARSVVFCLIRNFRPDRIFIANRTEQKANNLKRYFKQKMVYDSIKTFELFEPDLVEPIKHSKLVINCTSVGMYPNLTDSIWLSGSPFNSEQIAFDLIYNPTKSTFLKLAEQKGARTINGMKTLIVQAAKSFNLWTGYDMPEVSISDYFEGSD